MNEHKGASVTQIHLLCLDKHNSEAEKLLTEFLTCKERLIHNDKLERSYFPNNLPNEYTKDRTFVNVSFINPVPNGMK